MTEAAPRDDRTPGPTAARRAPKAEDAGELPPGPRLPRLAQTAAWLFSPIRFIESCRRRYGGRFTLSLGASPPLVALSDPGEIKEVFTGDPDVFHAGEANTILKPILGASSLLMLDGPRHRDERKLMMPAFHGERMQAYGKVMRERSDRAIDAWPLDRVFSLHKEMQDITLDVILRTVFGLEDGPHEAALRAALVRMVSFGDHPSLMLLIGRDGEVRGRALHERLGRLSPWASFQRTIEAVDQQLLREIQRRRGGEGAGRQDVLSMLLAARDEEGRSLGDHELVDEMKTLLVAGHETTATALTWTVLELIQHPDVWRRLVAELARGDEYLDAVIRESLRLHPIVPMVARLLKAPARVGGRDYPKGVVLAPNVYLVHTNPAVWPDPHRFDPDRFLGAKPSPYEYLPFGGGVRRCIGMAFALFEMRTVLRQIVSRAQLELEPRYRPRLVRRGITFAVSKGLPVSLVRRLPALA